jgi:hypothetical protein
VYWRTYYNIFLFFNVYTNGNLFYVLFDININFIYKKNNILCNKNHPKFLLQIFVFFCWLFKLVDGGGWIFTKPVKNCRSSKLPNCKNCLEHFFINIQTKQVVGSSHKFNYSILTEVLS